MLLTTRQPKTLKNMLVRAKFEIYTMLKALKSIGLVFLSFKLTDGKTLPWTLKVVFFL